MTSWGKAIGLGVLVWLVPFVVAFAAFSLHGPNRPLFESIMAVTVAATAVGFGLAYMRGIATNVGCEAVKVGILWLVISIVIDAPLMLVGGPMKMTVGAYMADIGLTYVCYPIILAGMGLAARGRRM